MRGYPSPAALPPIQSGVSRVHNETPAPELASVPASPPAFAAMEPSFVDIPMPEARVDAWPASPSVEVSMDDLAFAKKLQRFDLGSGLTAGFNAFVRDVRDAVSEKGVLAGVQEFRILRMKTMVATARLLHRLADELETRA
jgi:hypothetical protein